MGMALPIATMSFFLRQQKVFPVAWRGSPESNLSRVRNGRLGDLADAA
jgi:hypothetical protein